MSILIGCFLLSVFAAYLIHREYIERIPLHEIVATANFIESLNFVPATLSGRILQTRSLTRYQYRRIVRYLDKIEDYLNFETYLIPSKRIRLRRRAAP